jgi:hypothetical protein|tara:strand:+ start:2011 stop:2295 length:285 start_codon:yes stop_codon:yes gene_type:complete
MNKKIIFVQNYDGHGELLGGFTSIKKVIEYIKATTQNNNVLYDSYNNGWLGISYLKKSNLNNCYTFKTLEDTPSQQEQNVFKVTVVELNPTIEE